MSLKGRPSPPMAESEIQSAVDYAIATRRSIRGFLNEPVEPEVIRAILSTAARAPSGGNIQPWKVHVLTGGSLAALTGRMRSAFEAGDEGEREYQYYPTNWREPYLSRRRENGWGLYSLAGVERGDKTAGLAQHAKNFDFFGAPVGMVFTIDDDLEQGSWLDYGMFLQSIMVAARGRGLDTCPQAAIANYATIVKDELGIPSSQIVVCGMALGRADPDEPTNALVTSRQDLDGFVTMHG